MTIETLNTLWNFDPELKEGCEIKCPECCEYSLHKDWTESEVGCDDCGSHAAIVCPNCGEYFDHVGGPTFETRTYETFN